MKRALLALIVFYKRVLSPLLPVACRFTPTCSAFATEAITTHGALRGTRLAIGRLLRCRPFAAAGWDPVPRREAPGTAEESPR